MIKGIGVDVVNVDRFLSLEDAFLKKIFSNLEIEKSKETVNKAEFFASRFAAKEALSKANGTGIRNFSLNEISILNDSLGKPFFSFDGRAKEIFENEEIFLSFSHEKGVAVAMVVLCGEK